MSGAIKSTTQDDFYSHLLTFTCYPSIILLITFVKEKHKKLKYDFMWQITYGITFG